MPVVELQLRGRSVALVGPAAGVEIEPAIERIVRSVDFVARPNCKIQDGEVLLPRHTTRRCDIVYHNGAVLGHTAVNGLAWRMAPRGSRDRTVSNFSALCNATLRAYSALGVREVTVVSPLRVRRDNLASLAPHFPRLRLRDLASEIRQLGRANYTEYLRRRFRTGMEAVLDLLSRHPATLYVFGFDFYASLWNANDHRVITACGKQCMQRVSFDDYYARDLIGTPLAVGHHPHPRRELAAFAALLSRHRNLHPDGQLALLMQERLPNATARSVARALEAQRAQANENHSASPATSPLRAGHRPHTARIYRSSTTMF